MCPRGRGWCSGLIIEGGPCYDTVFSKATGPANHMWAWNGNREKPTFTPSINCLTHNPQNPQELYAGCGWHGHITDGIFNPPT